MRFPFLPLLLLAGLPGIASAQSMVQPLPGSSDADLLAATMRRVAANPLDLDALLTAGEQSLKVDDLAGAASLFARAEKIDPRSGRVKAGMASILVRSERPGEALRYFAQAAATGLDPRRFAADRGFAYDLAGDQPRAQADYRLALASGPADDETVRRYALSLGISGRTEEAMRQLQPLLGRSDRAAWRARAFILAMGGDQPGAERIATTMMPPGMAQGLRPFFERLPTLPAVDRAFAVHFGEVRSTPERLADARLTPALPPLAVEAPPVRLAAVATPVRAETRGERRRRERNEARARASAARAVQVASNRGQLAAPVSVPAAASVVTPPIQVAALARTAPASPLPTPSLAPVVPSGVVAASSTIVTSAATPSIPATRPVELVVASPGIASPAPAGLAPLITAAPPVTAPVVASAVPAVSPSAVIPAPQPASTVALAAVPSASPVAVAPRTDRRGRAPRQVAADSVLARIVASLSIPAAELGVAQPARAAGAAGDGAARTAEALRTKAAREAEAEAVTQRLVRGRPASGRRTLAATTTAAADTADEGEAPRSRRGRASAAADAEAETPRRIDPKKALADRKAAAEKKAAADKAAEEKRAARSNPSRIWVQVAGGAYEGDLPKAWAATRAKAPQIFAGRGGYSAKLRATNRVVTGPFKTDAEARAFVNQLAKAGVSAFPFTSDAGETVTRLPAR